MGANNKRIDMTGTVTKGWEALRYLEHGYWECRCTTCGKIKKFLGRDIRNNEIGACKHTDVNNTTKKESVTSRKDLTGQKFGHWTVLRYAGNRYWECQCDCANKTIRKVFTSSLLYGRSTNCGCQNRLDIIGKQFGELTVLRRSDKPGYVICSCSCKSENELEIRQRALINGNTRSCGCKTIAYKRETMLERYGEIATSRIYNPRDPDCIDACSSRENMLSIIDEIKQSIGRIPSLHDVANRLDITDTHTRKYIRQYNLEGEIQKNIYGAEENEVADFINSIGIADIERHVRSLIPGIELDIYIPSKKIAIEFNGTYWHSSQYKDKEYHQNKTIACAKIGVRLIHIFEYEWLEENSKSKIERYLRSILRPDTNMAIYGRNTEIVEVNTLESKEFISSNHLQGYTRALVSLGLKHNNELVMMMTFGKPRFSSSEEWELIRLVTKQGFTVIGGANKLFKHFVSEYKPKSIVSYCDISKFQGGIYKRLGFTTSQSSITEPNYVWAERYGSKHYKRYQTMKYKLLKLGLGEYGNTETEIMTNLGYLKVYDCGNLRFTWRK